MEPGGVSYTTGLYRVLLPVLLTLPLKLYCTWFPLTTDAVVHDLLTLSEQSGNETGMVKSLKVAPSEVDERVSEKKVLKQGAPFGNSVGSFRSMAISRNS